MTKQGATSVSYDRWGREGEVCIVILQCNFRAEKVHVGSVRLLGMSGADLDCDSDISKKCTPVSLGSNWRI